MAHCLVVDDDPQVGRLVRRILDAAGHSCVVALDPPEARSRLDLERYDVALVDLALDGDTDGLELLAEVTAAQPGVASVMMTGRADPVVVEKAAAQGASGFVVKPFRPSQLLATVTSSLNSRRVAAGDAEVRFERERILAEASDTLAGSLDYTTTVANLARPFIRVWGDLCVISIGDGRSGRARSIAESESARRLALDHEVAATLQRVTHSGEAEVHVGGRGDDTALLDAVRRFGALAAMVIPLRAELGVGAVLVATPAVDVGFDDEDVAFAQRLADRAGTALATAERWDERVRSEQRLRTLTDATRSLMWTSTLEGRRTFVSEGWLAFTGRSLEDELDWGWLDGVHPDDVDGLLERVGRAAEDHSGYEAEYRLRCRDGTDRWVLERCRPRWGVIDDPRATIPDPSSIPRGYVGSCIDITERKLSENALVWQATHDALTGLANRSYALSRGAEMLASLRRHPDRAACFFFVDVDGLKAINDRLGHATGDRVLREMADRLRSACRPDDLVARLGGDEFLLVTTAPDDRAAPAATGRRIVGACAAEVGEGLKVGAAVGIAVSTDPDDPIESVVERADQAMYEAKRAGGRCCRFADTDRQQYLDRTESDRRVVRRALDDGALGPVWGPLVDLETDDIGGLGLSARLAGDGTRVPVPRSDGAEELVGWYLRQARSRPRAVPVWLDLRDVTLGVLRAVRSRPELDDLEPGSVVLGVAPGLAGADGATETLEALARSGMRLALTGLGRGATTIADLAAFPGRHAVVRRPVEGDGANVGEGEMAALRALGYTVLAAGLDDDSAVRVARAHGCRLGSGRQLAQTVRQDGPIGAVGV